MTHYGLSNEAAQARLRQYGPNALPERPPTPLWRRLGRQFQSPLIYILLFALVADAAIWVSEGAVGAPVESIAIAIILLLNAGLGVYQESKSEAALARLKEMAAPMVWVMREGRLVHLPSAELVPGDLVRVEAGDRIPADGALIEAEGVMVDESALIGESVPIDKELDAEVFSGTLLVRGKGYIEIGRAGEKSAMGRLAVMIGAIEAEKTPLERRLEKFGGQIARGVLALAVLIAVGGLLVDGLERIGHVFLFAVALAVAAAPEGLPAVLTLTLALGVERMAKRKAVGNGRIKRGFALPTAHLLLLEEIHDAVSRQIQTRTRASSAVVRCAYPPRVPDCRPDRARSRDCLRAVEFCHRSSNGLDG